MRNFCPLGVGCGRDDDPGVDPGAGDGLAGVEVDDHTLDAVAGGDGQIEVGTLQSQLARAAGQEERLVGEVGGGVRTIAIDCSIV